MEEREREEPWAPLLTHALDILDGCAGQFAGKNNYHQDAVWGTKTGVVRNHCTMEAQDGKGPSDGYNNVPKLAVKGGLLAGELLNPGTRDLVIFNAKRCAQPSVPKEEKHGWWAAEGYIWAYYDTALFTKKAVPEAEGFVARLTHAPHRIRSHARSTLACTRARTRSQVLGLDGESPARRHVHGQGDG